MTDTTELARRVVAAPGWRWMPGMRATRPGPWAEPDSERVPESLPNGGYPGWLPDLSDPATIGCLRALVEVDGRVVMPWLPVNSSSLAWRLEYLTGTLTVSEPAKFRFRNISGATLVEALVEAMERARPVSG